MTDIRTLLTAHAVRIFRDATSVNPQHQLPPDNMFIDHDPVLAEAQQFARIDIDSFPETDELVDNILSDADFQRIAPKEEELDPMVIHPGGGMRRPPRMIITSLFTSAFYQMYLLQLSQDEETYVQIVLEAFDELRKGIRGELIKVYDIKGYTTISFSQSIRVSTPWGIVHPTPNLRGQNLMIWSSRPTTKCILVQPKFVPVVFDRSKQPQTSIDRTSYEDDPRSIFLFPLSCALASDDPKNPMVPVMTWRTTILPFDSGGWYSYSLTMPNFSPGINFDHRVSELERWAGIVNQEHVEEIDIAAKRLVSAVAHRTNKTDALIDAVMVWENLLGTSNEVTFRVSAALSKLIETDSTRRMEVKKNLSSIYSVRSRVVHGSQVDANKVASASSEAIETAVNSLRESYLKGKDWLSLKSNERSDQILLEWQ